MNILIETLGCPKNENDSQVAAGILENAGHSIIGSLKDADAVIINTCGFINDAKKESIERIFQYADLKDEKTLLIVSGCLSQRYGNELFDEMPEVDLFLGVNEYAKLPTILSNFEKGRREKYMGACDNSYTETGRRKLIGDSYTATVKISEGCNNVCAYCVIPYIRGRYRSRKKENIIAEAKLLAEKGVKELILIAQDVTNYGNDLYEDYTLASLMTDLCKIDQLKWIRIMYCYEDKITDELIETMAREPKVCKYIDIPIQHINTGILKAMNRKSTRESIIATIKKLRVAMPDINIRTTLITGLPGEKVAEFEELYDFVEDTEFERLGVFSYSREESTPAYSMKGQVRADVKERRREKILLLQRGISLKSNQSKIGRILEVLVEGSEEDGTYFGRTQYDAPEIDNSIVFKADRTCMIGEIVNVEVTDAFDYDLTGKLV